jgi:hypothetical protein
MMINLARSNLLNHVQFIIHFPTNNVKWPQVLPSNITISAETKVINKACHESGNEKFGMQNEIPNVLNLEVFRHFCGCLSKLKLASQLLSTSGDHPAALTAQPL